MGDVVALVKFLGRVLDAFEVRVEVVFVVTDDLFDDPRAELLVEAPFALEVLDFEPLVRREGRVDVEESEDNVGEVSSLLRPAFATVLEFLVPRVGEFEVLPVGFVFALDPFGPSLLFELVQDRVDGAVGRLPVATADVPNFFQYLVAVSRLFLEQFENEIGDNSFRWPAFPHIRPDLNRRT